MADYAVGNANTGFGAEIALANPPAQTNAGTATTLTFAAGVNHLQIQNKSAVDLYYETGGQTASPGSPKRYANGGECLLDFVEPITSISIYTASAVNINGTSDGNIVVKAWSRA